jgi:hypothetical protein
LQLLLLVCGEAVPIGADRETQDARQVENLIDHRCERLEALQEGGLIPFLHDRDQTCIECRDRRRGGSGSRLRARGERKERGRTGGRQKSSS